jgi:uncharacterized lipoprotein YajG
MYKLLLVLVAIILSGCNTGSNVLYTGPAQQVVCNGVVYKGVTITHVGTLYDMTLSFVDSRNESHMCHGPFVVDY